ncbi:MAG: hypothetical protein KBE65_02750 [Phycisphaerae bacterium]|nr:hypothetical protein [Phycisphaerae bacterium]
MGLNVRKFAVGFATLGALAGVFLLYMRFNRTPPIVVEPDRPAPVSTKEGSDPAARNAVGTIVGIDVENVRETEFVHCDQTGRIDRKFGFHELLHAQGNQWEGTMPYMEQLFSDAICRVTADRARVRLDDTFGRPMPTDAWFTGNVVIHLTPLDPNNPWECFIHLDDVGFLAEKSLFSSTGAVRFLSRPVRLTGTGMELVYNTAHSRIELFRIFDLDSLRMRISELKAVAGARSHDKERPDVERPAADRAEVEKDSIELAAGEGPKATVADSNSMPTDIYQCVFRKNARLVSPDGAFLAREALSINNIQWSGPGDRDGASRRRTEAKESRPPAPPSAGALDTTVSSHGSLTSIPEELYDVVVTCDGGADITLMNGPQGAVGPVATDANDHPPAELASEEIALSEPNQVVARRIDYDYSTRDATILGPFAAKLAIDPNRLGEKAGGKPMPAVVTARKMVRFLAATRQVVLEGDCTAVLRRSDPNADDEHRLTAPRLIADLAVDSNAAGDVNVDVRRFVADAGEAPAGSADPGAGSAVAVSMSRRVAGELLGWGSLNTAELQYDADAGQFTAMGPGVIWLNNNATIRSKDDPNEVTLEPCYVRLANFDALRYWSLSNRIVAEDDAQQLQVDYVPLVNGGYGPLTRVVAGHVEATLVEVVEGKMDLASLVASRGIAYDSEADQADFSGSELVYDRATDLMTIRGDEARPCRMNGVLVDHIVLNRKTGQFEAEAPTTSVFQVGP